MPIHFSCDKCGKALFAQEQYAGRTVVCPACQARSVIPLSAPALIPAGTEAHPTGPVAPSNSPPALAAAEPKPAAESDNSLAFAKPESRAEAPLENPPTTTAPAPGAPGAPSDAPALNLADEVPLPGQLTRKCPLCSETIRAEAKVCRYCKTILDEELRKEAERRHREHVALRVLQLAARTANTWRALGVIVTGFSTGMLLILTLKVWDAAPWPLPFFNILLMFGLLWSARQMKQGPHTVFVTAAWALLLCIPINILLGLPLNVALDMPAFEEMAKTIREHNPESSFRDAEQLKTALSTVLIVVGVLISIPVWIASWKVAALQRLRAALGVKP